MKGNAYSFGHRVGYRRGVLRGIAYASVFWAIIMTCGCESEDPHECPGDEGCPCSNDEPCDDGLECVPPDEYYNGTYNGFGYCEKMDS